MPKWSDVQLPGPARRLAVALLGAINAFLGAFLGALMTAPNTTDTWEVVGIALALVVDLGVMTAVLTEDGSRCNCAERLEPLIRHLASPSDDA
ncbi:MAG TPA: hypothetical protein VHV76_12705 [Mycobacteriales bacterium]|jgi:hypothetical protein|nr:hypothetical protein [Mycobacteriales bacterium]